MLGHTHLCNKCAMRRGNHLNLGLRWHLGVIQRLVEDFFLLFFGQG
jgi:hypothetical protein